MAPVATEPNRAQNASNDVASLKAKAAPALEEQKVFNPFYSPPGDDDGDDSYEYERYKVYLECI